MPYLIQITTQTRSGNIPIITFYKTARLMCHSVYMIHTGDEFEATRFSTTALAKIAAKKYRLAVSRVSYKKVKD